MSFVLEFLPEASAEVECVTGDYEARAVGLGAPPRLRRLRKAPEGWRTPKRRTAFHRACREISPAIRGNQLAVSASMAARSSSKMPGMVDWTLFQAGSMGDGSASAMDARAAVRRQFANMAMAVFSSGRE